MKDKTNTYQELLDEISALRKKIHEYEISEARHRLTEKTLSLNLQRMRLLLDAGPDFFFMKNIELRYELINLANAKFFNLNEKDILGKTDMELMPAMAAAKCQETDRLAIKEKRLVVTIEEVDGRYYETHKFPIFDEGQIIGVGGIVRDVTENIMYEKALKESEERFRRLFQYHNAVKMVIDPDTGYIIDANEAAVKFYGWPIEKLKQMRIQQINILPEEKVEAEMKKAQLSVQDRFEFKHIMADGSVRDVEVFSNKIEIGNKTVLHSVIHDITARVKAEEDILKEREKLRNISDNAPFGMVLIDEDGCFTYMNKKFTELFGYELADIPDGKTWFKKAYPDIEYRHNVISAWIEDFKNAKIGEHRPRVFNVTCKNGSQKVVSFVSSIINPGNYLMTCEDVTEIKRIEFQLHQAQKMESIGTLAGGIAHDFNNLLMGIQGYTSLMLLDIDPSHPHYVKLKRIEEQVQSGANLAGQLLGFARGGRYEVKPTDINEIIKKTSSMFAKTKKEIVFHRKYAKDLLSVEADRGQMEQVFMNLYINAWQAMPGGGEIYLETENVFVDDEQAFPYEVKPGRYVKVTVTDTGTGMDEKTRERIFEPFFTTKSMERGTGLGLAMVYGIIKGHKGFINVYSELGHGTTFTVYLPSSDKEVDKVKKSSGKISGGTETILFVDDEKAVLEVGSQMLELLGYKVYAADGGQTAIDIYREKHNEISLVILDMIMPGVSGGKTFDALKEINQDVKVVLSSGYSLNGEASDILNRGCMGFLQKPFRLETLASKIRELLGLTPTSPEGE